MIFIIIFPLLGVLVLIGACIYTYMDNNKKKSKAIKNENNDKGELENNARKLTKLKEYISIDDFRNSQIKLKNGSLRVLLSISSSDFELLTDEEQKGMENCLIQFGLSLSSPVQFFTTPTRIETKEPSEALDILINSADKTIPDRLREHSNRLLVSLKKLESERGIYVRRSFCVIGVNDIVDPKRALNELKHRVNVVASKLSRARMRVNLLDSKQVAQVLTDILQKGSNVLIGQLVDNGVLELYSEGSGVIVFEEQEENKSN